MSGASPNASRIVRILAALAIAGLLFYVLRVLPVRDLLERFLAWIQELGPTGVVVFVLGYAIAALLLPASLLTLGAGAAFGPVVGTAAVSVGSTTTACLAFLIGRRFARRFVEAKMASFPKFQAVDRAVAGQGFKIVLLTRLSPAFPFTWMNYAYGLTQVRFRDYALASWLGMLPGTAMYVYFGHAGKLALQAASGGTAATGGNAKLVMQIIAGLATVAVTIVVTRVARKALAEAVPGAAAPAGGAPANPQPTA